MKAFLLAAGKGTRLKPYTSVIPKCLIPIHGKPLLEIWIELLERSGVSEILINTHHHADKVERFLKRIRSKVKPEITLLYEKKLLGSGGTIWTNREAVMNEKNFLIIYADNLTTIDLERMIKQHDDNSARGGILTMGLIHAPVPQECGIVTLDNTQKIVSFIEKPDNPASDLANGGIYVANPEIFSFFTESCIRPTDRVCDLGFHILPKLTGKMYGYEIKEYLRDIGTIESYDAAIREWRVYPFLNHELNLLAPDD
jgi:mannose-1-phosphate guanylyltransferase